MFPRAKHYLSILLGLAVCGFFCSPITAVWKRVRGTFVQLVCCIKTIWQHGARIYGRSISPQADNWIMLHYEEAPFGGRGVEGT